MYHQLVVEQKILICSKKARPSSTHSETWVKRAPDGLASSPIWSTYFPLPENPSAATSCEKFGMHTINRDNIVRYNNKHANN